MRRGAFAEETTFNLREGNIEYVRAMAREFRTYRSGGYTHLSPLDSRILIEPANKMTGARGEVNAARAW